MPTGTYRKPYTRAQGARKPATPQQQLQRAIERMQEARKEGADLRVIAVGKVLATSQPVYFVPSQTVVGMWHAIVQTESGLACDCFYSKERHQVCVHRAVVYEHLKGQPKAAPAPKISMIMVHCAIGEHENCNLDCCTCSCHQKNKNAPAALAACTCGNRLAWVAKRDQARCLKCGWQGRMPTAQPASSGDSPQTVAVSSPDAATAPSGTLKVAAPTQTPTGVLVAATAPQVGISDEDRWTAYQDARRTGWE